MHSNALLRPNDNTVRPEAEHLQGLERRFKLLGLENRAAASLRLVARGLSSQ